MFKFKKSMEGISEEENLECQCCGSMYDPGPESPSECLPDCGLEKDSGLKEKPENE